MTSRSDRLPLSLAPTGEFPWHRLALSFLITLLAILLFVAAFALGYSRLHEGRALPGVEVGGISLAGLDRHAAEVKLREELPALSAGSVNVQFADISGQVPYSAIGRDYDMQLMLDQAMSIGHDGPLFEQVQEQLRILLHGVAVTPSMTWDSAELSQRVAAIAAGAEIAPTDATISRQDGRYVVVPAIFGQTVDVAEGIERAMAAVNNLSANSTNVTISAEAIPPQVTSHQAQAALDRVERVVAADLPVAAAGEQATITAEMLRGWVRLEEASAGNWTLIIEQEPITQFVQNFALQIDQPAVDASFEFNSEGVATAVPSQEGRAVDVASGSSSIMASLQGRDSGSGSPSINLAVLPVAPAFTTAEARQLASRVEMLSKWTTKFVPSALNGNGANIAIPTRIIDGYVVQPGGKFDFLDIIGPITEEAGYTKGAAIIRGRTRLDGALGGGMCSCSTTAFNAALRAGLDMGARRNHYYYIGRYPVGLDATVWISSATQRQTMAFTNDNPYPILVRGINRTGRVTFQIWGVPDGRTVEILEPRIEDEKKATTVIQYTDALAPLQRNQVEWPVDGFKSWVTRIVRDASGNVLHEDTYYSNYRTITGIVMLGRSPGDPKAGTKVPFFPAGGGNPPDEPEEPDEEGG